MVLSYNLSETKLFSFNTKLLINMATKRFDVLFQNKIPSEGKEAVFIYYCHKCRNSGVLPIIGTIDVEINTFRRHEINGVRCLEMGLYKEAITKGVETNHVVVYSHNMSSFN